MDIPALLASLVSAKELAGALIGERDAHKLATIQNDLTERITEAQLKLAEVAHVLGERTALAHALQDRVRELEEKQALRSRYQLVEVVTGVFAYRLKADGGLGEESAEPSHLVCQSCLDVRGARSVLNRLREGGTAFRLVCHGCGFSFREDGRG